MSFHTRAGRVLLVEDSRAVVALARAHLEPEGFLVETAATLRDALAAVREAPPACILLDMGLPDVGPESGKRGDSIFALRRVNTACALVVLTGADFEIPALVASHHVQAWCSKGLDWEILPWVIRCAVAHMDGIHRGIEAAAASL